MPDRFTSSVVFKWGDWDFVQVGDHSGMWILVPVNPSGPNGPMDPNRDWIRITLEALNLWDASQKLAPKMAEKLAEVSNG